MTGYRVKTDILVIWRLNVFFRKEKGPTFGLFYLFKNILQNPEKLWRHSNFKFLLNFSKTGFIQFYNFPRLGKHVLNRIKKFSKILRFLTCYRNLVIPPSYNSHNSNKPPFNPQFAPFRTSSPKGVLVFLIPLVYCIRRILSVLECFL